MWSFSFILSYLIVLTESQFCTIEWEIVLLYRLIYDFCFLYLFSHNVPCFSILKNHCVRWVWFNWYVIFILLSFLNLVVWIFRCEVVLINESKNTDLIASSWQVSWSLLCTTWIWARIVQQRRFLDLFINWAHPLVNHMLLVASDWGLLTRKLSKSNWLKVILPNSFILWISLSDLILGQILTLSSMRLLLFHFMFYQLRRVLAQI